MGKSASMKTVLYAFALLIAGTVAAGLAWRLAIGFDFSDEAYYAAFLDDWLKESIAKSPLLTLHQTAALLVYPAALAFRYVNGSLDGFFLFLRVLFLLGNVIAAAAFFHFMRRMTGNLCAFLGALAVLCFIAASLPAPSYNTIGIQSLTVALSMLGLALTSGVPHQRMYFAASAVAWAIAAVAYPTLLLAVGMFFILLPLRLPEKRQVMLRFYFPVLVACLAAAAGIVISLLSWQKLHASVVFLAAFNGSLSVSFKLATYIFIVLNHKGFFSLFCAATILGCYRQKMNATHIALASAFIVTAILLFPDRPSTLIFRSYDIIALAGFCGMSLLGRSRPDAGEGERLLAILYSISFCAGMVTIASSTNGLMNFCIGGLPAAVIAMSTTAVNPAARKATAASLAAFVAVLLFLGLHYYYDDKYGAPEKREYIDWGEAKGLYVAQDVANVMDQVRTKVNPLLNSGDSILVLGRLPGLGLLTPAIPKALCIYPMYRPFTTPAALAMVHGYYSISANRPEIVVIYQDRYMQFTNPFAADFNLWYAPVASYRAPPGTLEIYRKRQSPAVPLHQGLPSPGPAFPGQWRK